MRILVIGGGLAGLSCAEALHDRGFEVTLSEERAEIGHPQILPGLVEDAAALARHAVAIQLGPDGCRRPWLAKALAQDLAGAGVDIRLRTRGEMLTGFDRIIDARTSSGPTWEGGVTLPGRIPIADLVAHRGDGTIECWFEGPLPEVEGGWLERFTGRFTRETASVDAALARGRLLASEPKT